LQKKEPIGVIYRLENIACDFDRAGNGFRLIRNQNLDRALSSKPFGQPIHKSVVTTTPIEIIGSGLESDVLAAGQQALKEVTKQFMSLFGSAGES
jgi:hypothetical protein